MVSAIRCLGIAIALTLLRKMRWQDEPRAELCDGFCAAPRECMQCMEGKGIRW